MKKLRIIKTIDVLTGKHVILLDFNKEFLSKFEITRRRIDTEILEIIFSAYKSDYELEYIDKTIEQNLDI